MTNEQTINTTQTDDTSANAARQEEAVISIHLASELSFGEQSEKFVESIIIGMDELREDANIEEIEEFEVVSEALPIYTTDLIELVAENNWMIFAEPEGRSDAANIFEMAQAVVFEEGVAVANLYRQHLLSEREEGEDNE